jgi:hypothetical protein
LEKKYSVVGYGRGRRIKREDKKKAQRRKEEKKNPQSKVDPKV